MKELIGFVASKASRIAVIAAVLAIPTVAAGADQLRSPDNIANTRLRPPVTISGSFAGPLLSTTQSGPGDAIYAGSRGGNGISAYSSAGDGIYGLSSAGAPNYRNGVYGQGLNGSIGVQASSDTGVALFAHTNTSGISLDVFAPPKKKGYPIYVFDSTGENPLMYLDTRGNMWLAGGLTQFSSGRAGLDSVARLRSQLRKDEDRIARDERELSDVKQTLARLVAEKASR